MLETCTVRSLDDDDLPMVLIWRNHPEVRRYMLTQHEISLQEHRNWFNRVRHDKTRQLLIVLDDTDPLGFVQFHPVSQGGIADWGFYARPDAPKGCGRRLGQAALDYAFKHLGLYKVCGQALEGNAASITLHQKLGFTEEGRQLEEQVSGGKCRTLICFGLLADNWNAIQRP